jgi:hypothetical protein
MCPASRSRHRVFNKHCTVTSSHGRRRSSRFVHILSGPVSHPANNNASPDTPQKKARVFRPARTVMPREAAARQLRLTMAAWTALRTPERVKAFLNSDHAALSARPIDLAIASDAGLMRVERLLSEQICIEPAAV